jgi:hypothetical protein
MNKEDNTNMKHLIVDIMVVVAILIIHRITPLIKVVEDIYLELN